MVISLLGCIEERAFQILQNQVPQSGCQIGAEFSSIYRPSGLLDVSVGKGYVLFPLLRSELPTTASGDNQPERNTIQLRRFHVTVNVRGAIEGADVLEFDVPSSGTMDPGELRSSIVEVIPDDLARLLEPVAAARPTLQIKVQAVAEHNGSTITSTEFFYPVELCNGCLVTFLSACPAADEDDLIKENFCGLPQDGPVTCCDDPDRGVICLRFGGA